MKKLLISVPKKLKNSNIDYKNNQMKKISGKIVTIGNFDGIHLGHNAIVKRVLKLSEKENMGTVLITFNPNPKVFFKKENGLIFTEKQKNRFLNSLGIDKIDCMTFKSISNMEGEEFIEKYLIEKYSMKFLVVGENFNLGKGRTWNTKKIKSVEKKFGFKLVEVKSEKLDGIKISSSKIRELLRKGDLQTANRMLGKNYSILGEVVSGNKIGRKLGFPTANVTNENCLLPNGVYESKIELDSGMLKSVTYIGNSPTLKDGLRKIETHILNFNSEVYNTEVEVFFLKKIRNEIKFSSEEELISRIRKDIETAKVDFK